MSSPEPQLSRNRDWTQVTKSTYSGTLRINGIRTPSYCGRRGNFLTE